MSVPRTLYPSRAPRSSASSPSPAALPAARRNLRRTNLRRASVTIEDNTGTHEIATPPASVVALDNRTFQTLSDWGVELSAGAVALMPETVSYVKDDGIVDIGLHSEPDLEAVVAVEPDLIISGQRFTQHNAAIADLVPEATIIDLEPREGEPFDEELKRQVTALGEIFGKQDEAQKLVDDFDAAVERAQAAYDDADTVMAVNTSGGEIGYLAPTVGRSLGPIYDILGLTPALESRTRPTITRATTSRSRRSRLRTPTGSSCSTATLCSLRRPPTTCRRPRSWRVPRRSAGVTAVKDEQIVYMPTDTYLNEGIQTYTTFLEDFADALEAAKN